MLQNRQETYYQMGSIVSYKTVSDKISNIGKSPVLCTLSHIKIDLLLFLPYFNFSVLHFSLMTIVITMVRYLEAQIRLLY